jgi:hypothetical protein
VIVLLQSSTVPFRLIQPALFDVLPLLSEWVSVVDSMPSSISLPEGMPLSNAVPLAAVLPDYEVTYVPSDTQQDLWFFSVESL